MFNKFFVSSLWSKKKERSNEWFAAFRLPVLEAIPRTSQCFPTRLFFFIHSRVFTVLYLSLSVSTVYILLACLLSFVSVCVLPRSTVEGTLTTRFTYVLVSHLKKKKKKKRKWGRRSRAVCPFFFCVCVYCFKDWVFYCFNDACPRHAA